MKIKSRKVKKKSLRYPYPVVTKREKASILKDAISYANDIAVSNNLSEEWDKKAFIQKRVEKHVKSLRWLKAICEYNKAIRNRAYYL